MRLADTPRKTADYLELAAWYASDISGFLFKPRQLSHYDWLPAEAGAYSSSLRHPASRAGESRDFLTNLNSN
jgi:hypothetical protein